MHFRQASLALDDREEKLAVVADNIERDMVITHTCIGFITSLELKTNFWFNF